MNVDFNIINQKGSPAIFSDTYANRPAASYPGRLFISTDTKEIYRDTGTAWEEIAGSGSGNIQGSGTANYVPKFTDTETIGNSQIRDDGTGVGIGVAPSAVYYVDIGGSQRNTLSAAGGFTLRQSGSTIAAYGVYDSASDNAFLFSKNSTTNEIYSVGKIQHKIFDGASNYFTSEFVTGNWAINSVTDAGFKLDVNGTVNFSGALTGTSAAFTSTLTTSAKISANITKSGSGIEALDFLEFRLFGTDAIGDSLNIKFRNNSNINVATISGILGGDNVVYGSLAFSTRNYFTDSMVEVMRINNRGNILVNTTTDAGYKLDVNGTGRFSDTLTTVGITYTGAITMSGASAFFKSSASGYRFNDSSDAFNNMIIADLTGNTTIRGTVSATSATFSSSVKVGNFTTTQKNALTASSGMVVYDTTLNKLCVYTTAWETITSI